MGQVEDLLRKLADHYEEDEPALLTRRIDQVEESLRDLADGNAKEQTSRIQRLVHVEKSLKDLAVKHEDASLGFQKVDQTHCKLAEPIERIANIQVEMDARVNGVERAIVAAKD